MPANKSVEKALAAMNSDASKTLGLTVGQHTQVKPGTYIPKAGMYAERTPVCFYTSAGRCIEATDTQSADAQSPPEILYPAASADKTYLAMSLDLDAPFKSLPVLGPIWHWCQSDLRIASAAGTATTTPSGKLEPAEPPVVNYIGPAPPPGASPHRYAFFLYEQPAGFDAKARSPAGGKEVGVKPRMWFSLDEWEAKVGLGEVLALNYFTSN